MQGLDWAGSAGEEEGCGFVELARVAGGIFAIAWRDVKDEALAGTREQNPVGIAAEGLPSLAADIGPSSYPAVPEAAAEPFGGGGGPDEVSSPAEANPVEFKALNLELGGVHFELLAGTSEDGARYHLSQLYSL